MNGFLRLRHMLFLSQIGIRHIVWIALITVTINAQATELRAWLDRDTMQIGETVTLNVEITGTTNSESPDFSALKQDFQLLGTSSSTSVNMVNGSSSAKLLWAVGLEPKHEGTIVVPALTIGGASTAALSLKVLPAPAGATGKQGDDVYIEVKAEPQSPYVQQQIRYSVKLYFAVNLTDGNIEEPHADGLVVKKLGQDQNYQAMVGGRRYHVIERHYALAAEKSGTLTLPAINFRGRAIDPGDVNSFFNRGRTLSARSDAIALEVRPRPADSGTASWLPAVALSLAADAVDGTTTARVGEPLTLTLRIKAQGLSQEQLPELELPHIDGADVYPDKSVTHTRDNDGWLYAERERKFAIVPTRAGKLALPALSIDWWDTEHDRGVTAQLPAQEFDVQATAVVAPTPSRSVATEPADAQKPGAIEPNAALPTFSGEPAWRLIAFISFGLWVLSVAGGCVFMYVRRQRRLRGNEAPALKHRSKAAKIQFRVACAKTNLSAISNALLVWARDERPDLRNLGELARVLTDANQREALSELERARYGGGADTGLVVRLRHAFAQGFSFEMGSTLGTPNSVLPPLYPFKQQKAG